MHSQVWGSNSAAEERQCYWPVRVPPERRISESGSYIDSILAFFFRPLI